MSHMTRHSLFSARHVAKNGDAALAGGYVDIYGPVFRVWPRLHMHIRIGNRDGAVWSCPESGEFLLVTVCWKTGQFQRERNMSAAELTRFVARDGVFYTLI